MHDRQRSGFWAFLTGIWWLVNLFRRAVMAVVALFLVLGAVLLLGALAGGGVVVPESAALVLNPTGDVVEQLSGDATDRALRQLLGEEEPETLLRDLLDAIGAAKDDERIKALVLDLGGMRGIGPSKLRDLKRAIVDFQESGKPVVAIGDFYARDQYYLASLADEVFLHELGLVLLDGYSRYRTYYKQGIDRFELDWHVFRVGEYKSAVEPYLRDDMSPEVKEANLDWLGDLWRVWVVDVAEHRGLTPEQLEAQIASFPEALKAVRGDTAQLAHENGLVDRVGFRDAARQYLVELVGEDEEEGTFNSIGFEDYLLAYDVERPERESTTGESVAVIVAKGTILDGTHPPGTIGGDSTSHLIREAREDEEIGALVVRVDSPGGSAFASDVIRRELVLAREAGKPVVISMGSVAASGGYWIATASDEIWASPTTITGSIGIFGTFPTFQRPMAKYLGWHVDGVGTTPLAGAMRADRELQPALASTIQTLIERGYEEFLSRVAEARDMERAEVEQIARGRVWSGEDAHRLGLVDRLGGLEEAIDAAARLAEMEEGWGVRTIEKELDFQDQLIVEMLSRAAGWVDLGGLRGGPSFLERLAARFEEETELMGRLNDPHGIYAHCLCEVY